MVLAAILLTAVACSLVWWRTADATSRQLASTINDQIVAAVRKEVASIVDQAHAAHTAIRTLFLQNVLETREADKREFVFLSQLQSHPTISWAAFGWPDGSFFAAHKLGDRRLEMMEISLTDHAGERRIDEYDVVPGDIEFASRRFVPTGFRVTDQAWFKAAIAADGPSWFKIAEHPTGERAAIAFAGPIDVYQERQGVLAIIIEYTRLSRFLSQLEVGRTGAAFIFDGSGALVASPDAKADEINPAQAEQPALLPLARQAVGMAIAQKMDEAWRSRLVDAAEAYETTVTPLPFPGWRLATVLPEAEFLGPVQATLHRLILMLVAGAALAAIASAILVRSMIAVPLARVVGELRHVEAFALEAVRRHPSRLREIGSLSGAIAEMASGLSAFRKFIPTDLVRGLLRQGVEAKPGGTLQELSVMFIDIAGFTGLSERMGDGIVGLLSRYLDLVSEVVVAHGGTIDKFIGDAVMAFWGAPQPQSDHALRCCLAALACQRAIAEAGLVDDLGQALRIRIGINTGRMLVGNIGSELRLNYTVIGDAVNVASRLEGANKAYGTTALMGEATANSVGRSIIVREVDRIGVYGREQGLAAYELVAPAADAPTGQHPPWIVQYERALARYRVRDFAGAVAGFAQVLMDRPHDGPATVMLERSRRMLADAGDTAWQPVAALSEK
ncbi:adenylate/guanylate cyclase domain-containing protein [Bradyrhizobium sp. HKCCYLS3077]|uniref:adenylate/guanylate cyclase domain-containing protein n=1 Tax=Bradyrhizobium sp. HKCCYLS3077 TaxID=3420761 RepID=UPI003EBE52B4